MAVRVIKKSLAGSEDLLLGFGTEVQVRNDKNIEITKINASNIPYDENKSISEFIDNITKKVDTLANMRTMNELPETVWCSGYHSKNDGAFGIHFFRLKGLKTTETDNGGTVIVVSVGGSDYVYELQYDGAVNVKWFGAKGDGITDDTVAIQSAIDYALLYKKRLIASGNFLTGTLAIGAGLSIEGIDGAVQQGTTFTANGDINIFYMASGFAAESMEFTNLVFTSKVAGEGIAFASPNTTFISNVNFTNCVFNSKLKIGIEAPIIVCAFYKCDFGSYDGTTRNFIAIKAVGTIGSKEPNANSFYNCIFRKSNAVNIIEIGSYGVQWHFNQCDFEQNACTSELIKCDGSGAITFNGGYMESNSTPYVIRIIGSAAVAFTNLVSFKNVHFNSPCTDAIVKREIAFPPLEMIGCYGRLNCNIFKNELNIYNSASDLAMAYGNSFNIGTGAIGEIDTITTGGYNVGDFRIKNNYAEGFSAYTTVVQALVSGVAKKLLFATVETQTPNWYDFYISKFTTQKAGTFLVSVQQAAITASATGSLTLYLYKNGELYMTIGKVDFNGVAYPILSATVLAFANVGDYFEVFALSDLNVNLHTGLSNTRFQMKYLSI